MTHQCKIITITRYKLMLGSYPLYVRRNPVLSVATFSFHTPFVNIQRPEETESSRANVFQLIDVRGIQDKRWSQQRQRYFIFTTTWIRLPFKYNTSYFSTYYKTTEYTIEDTKFFILYHNFHRSSRRGGHVKLDHFHTIIQHTALSKYTKHPRLDFRSCVVYSLPQRHPTLLQVIR